MEGVGSFGGSFGMPAIYIIDGIKFCLEAKSGHDINAAHLVVW